MVIMMVGFQVKYLNKTIELLSNIYNLDNS